VGKTKGTEKRFFGLKVQDFKTFEKFKKTIPKIKILWIVL
jgi:hypothetical protein